MCTWCFKFLRYNFIRNLKLTINCRTLVYIFIYTYILCVQIIFYLFLSRQFIIYIILKTIIVKLCSKKWWNNYLRKQVIIIEKFGRRCECIGSFGKVRGRFWKAEDLNFCYTFIKLLLLLEILSSRIFSGRPNVLCPNDRTRFLPNDTSLFLRYGAR